MENLKSFKFKTLLLMIICPIVNLIAFAIQFIFNTEHFIPCIIFICTYVFYIIVMSTIKCDIESRRNRELMIYSTIIKYGFLVGATFEHTYEGARAYEGFGIWGYMFNNFLPIILFIYEMRCFRGNPKSKALKYYTMLSFLGIFLTLTFGVESFWVGFIAIPILTIYATLDDMRLVIIGTIATNLINMFGVFRQLDFGYDSSDKYPYWMYFMQVCFIALFTLSVLFTSILSRDINKNTIAIIEDEKEKIDNLSSEILDIGVKVKNNSNKTIELIEDLNTATNNSLSVMKDISSGNVNNKISITEQKEMTRNIYDLIKETIEEVDKIKEETEKTVKGLQKSKKSYNILKNKSNIIASNNRKVTEVIEEFIKQAQLVKDSINSIYNVSDETSLLALNAAIESVKAKEDGKGFTVIASEIRNLAEQTATLADSITHIVENLEDNSVEVNKNVKKVVKEMDYENEVIDSALEDYNNIENAIMKLEESVKYIYTSTENVVEYNEMIMKHVDELDNLSEKVNKNTSKATDMNHKNIRQTDKATEQLHKLIESTKKIEKYVNNMD